jgi:hypothetical protein
MLLRVRISAFWELVNGEFGRAQGESLVRDHVLFRMRNRTAAQALADGEEPRDVWLALCDAMDVPPERRLGVEQQSGKQSRRRG